jgi:hypothetical protein
VALTGADRIDVINGAGERTASITVPAGSLPTNSVSAGVPSTSCSSRLHIASRCCVSVSTTAVTPLSRGRRSTSSAFDSAPKIGECIQLQSCGQLHSLVL